MPIFDRMIPEQSRSHRDLKTWGLFLAIGLVMLTLTWGKWADVTIDFGRELYVPWRLAQGDVLYRDVAYLNGPLSPYLNAFVFLMFGVGFRTLVLVNLFWISVLLVFLYRIFRQLEGEFAARLAGLSFLLIFAFGRLTDIGNYNFVAPYSHELLHGMVLIMLEIWLLGRFEDSGRQFWLVAAASLLGLTFLTKPEICLAAAAATAAAWALSWRKRGFPGTGVLCGALMAAAMPVFIAWFSLLPALGRKEALHALLLPWRAMINRDLLSLPFYSHILGIDSIGLNLLRMFGMSLLWGVVLGLPILLERGPVRRVNCRYYHTFAVIATFTIGVTDYSDFLRPLPVALLGVGFVSLGRSSVLRVAISAAAAALLLKIVLNVHLWHYGFALAMPATLIIVTSGIGSVADALGRLGTAGDAFRSTVRGMWVALIALHIGVSCATLMRIHFPVGNGIDRFQADERGPVVQAALNNIAQRTAASQTLAVLPEGVMLNYLARLETSTRYINFMPPEVMMFGEGPMLAAFAGHPPDLIALVDKDTSEYGFRAFGEDYGRDLVNWIAVNYRETAHFGHPPLAGKGFGILLLKRR